MKSRDYYCELLNETYKKYYLGGKCKYYEECKGNIPDCKFCFDKANVGIEYGCDDSIPRIVIVGLEALGKSDVVSSVYEPSLKAYNPHYKGVRYVLSYLLSGCANVKTPQNALKSTLEQYKKDLKKYTLLNCYKCAFSNKAQGLPHTDSMKKHCKHILIDEIKCLEPDFLVIQVKSNLPDNFENNLLTNFPIEKIISTAGDNYTRAYVLRSRETNKRFILIWTYHGSGSPIPNNRSWANDNAEGNRYIVKYLNPILNQSIEEYKRFVKE